MMWTTEIQVNLQMQCQILVQSLWQECSCRFLRVTEKACRKSLRSAVESGQNLAWKEVQVKIWVNMVIVRRMPQASTSSLYSCGSRSNEHTWFDWQIYHLAINTTHAVPIRKLRSWTNGFFKIVGFAGKRFLSSLPLPLLVLFCARPNFRAFKKRKILQACGKPYGNACYAGYEFRKYSKCNREFIFNC